MERTFKVILKPLQRFAIQKPNASVLLFLATILAMILANSPLQDRYHHFLQFPVKLVFGDFSIFSHHGEPLSMLAFVNDALMAVFFLLLTSFWITSFFPLEVKLLFFPGPSASK